MNTIVENIRNAWFANNLPPDRLQIIPPFRRGEHLAALAALADVALDTANYGGGMTSFEALAAGLPLIHGPGGDKIMIQRAGGSCLLAAGLSDLVVETVPSYVDLAVQIGSDETYRSDIKARFKHKLERATQAFSVLKYVSRHW